MLLLFLISGWIHLIGLSVDEFNRHTLSVTAKGIQAGVYILAFIGIFVNLSKVTKLITENLPLFLLFLIACCSYIWSIDPAFSLFRTVGLLGTIAIAVILALNFSVDDFSKWMLFLFMLIALLNYVAIYFFPEISLRRPHDYTSAWRGIFCQKNHLGHNMAFFLIIGYLQLLLRRISLTFFLIILSVAAPLLLFSKSAAAIVILVAGCIISSLVWLYCKYNFSLLWIISALLLTVICVYFFRHELITLLGKNDTLTGRTVTWKYVFEQSQDMPILGHGYATWLDYKLIPEKHKYLMTLGGHNGYLDILFWFGWTGVLSFILFILDMLCKLFIILNDKYHCGTTILLTVFFLTFCIVNIPESLFLVRSGLLWIIFVFVALKINNTFCNYLKNRENSDRDRSNPCISKLVKCFQTKRCQ